jgi:transcription termination factor Rho
MSTATSTVLDINNLLESPLADLHAIAGELEIEGYRLKSKPDLTIAILETRGVSGDEIRATVTTRAEELAKARAEREAALAEAEEAAEAEREAAREAQAAEHARGGGRNQQNSRNRQRGGRGGRGGRDQQAQPGERKRRGEKPAKADDAAKTEQQKPARPPEPTTPLAGVFEPGAGGGGRLRTDLTRRVRGDADVPRGEVRRWKLKRGDLVNAQVKKARRGRTDFVAQSIDSVNGQNLDARKSDAPAFEERAAAAVAGRYAKRTFKHAPIGAGSRLVVTGPTRAAASEMLKKLSEELAAGGVVTTLVVVTARPEQSAAISGVEVICGDATKAPDDVLPALELALERDKRLAEGGRETALLVDGLDLLDATKALEIFSAARNLAEGGALTVAASAGAGSALETQATSIAVVAGGRKLKLDKKSSWSA